MTDQTTPPPVPGDVADAGTDRPRERPVFRRTSGDKVIAGVAGGLARTFGQDPVVVRIITVVLALAFPPAFIAYLAAWLLVARDDEPSRPPSGGIAFRQAGGVGFWIGVVVLVGALFATFDEPFSGGFNLLPLVLIGIGVALWTRDGGSGGATTSATASQPGTGAWPQDPSTTGAAMSTTHTPAAPGAAPPGIPPTTAPPTSPEPAPAGPPPPPRPRSPLGAITIALALIATGVVAALDQVEGLPLDADPSHLAAVALLVLGLGQLVGALWGRARWLSLVALFLIPPVVVGTVIREIDADFDFDGISLGDGVGERVLVIDGDDELPTDVGLAAGNLELDLRDWSPDAAARAALDDDPDVTVDVGAGEVTVTTPTDVPWRIVGDVRLGEIQVTGTDGSVDRTDTEDAGIPLDVELHGGPQDGDVLDIEVDVRLGQLNIITTTYDSEELS